MESLRLEKTSKVIKSNCQPNTTVPTKPGAISTRFLNTSRDGDSTASLGSLLQCPSDTGVEGEETAALHYLSLLSALQMQAEKLDRV